MIDDIEFDEQAPVLIQEFRSRIPAEYWAGFEYKLDGGEYAMALDTLVNMIEDEHLPVTADERDRLRDMLVFLGEDTSVVDAVIPQPNPGPENDQ